jgi:hypothetical protein
VTLREGRRGQFDVLRDGKIVASRKGGYLGRLLKVGFPDEARVIAELRSMP